MMKTTPYKNKTIFLKTALALLGGSLCCTSNATSFDARGGNFKYVESSNNKSDQCPGPYESVELTFVNKTTDVTTGHGLALAYNIYYVVNDERNYTGKYAYPENDSKTFPSEHSGVKDAEYATGNDNWTYYGPIEGTYVDSKNSAQIPVRADVRKEGTPLRTSSTIATFEKPYGEENVKLTTAYAKSGNFMDWTSSGKNTVSVRLPVRNYKRLLIEVKATDIPSTQAVSAAEWKDNKNSTAGVTGTAIYFDALATSSANGSIVEVLAYRPLFSGFLSHTTPSSVVQNKSQSLQVGSFPFQSTINLRAVDQITITTKGNFPVGKGVEEWKDENFYSGSSISVNYLKDKKTGKDVICN